MKNNIPNEIIAIQELPNDFEKFIALFKLFENDFKIIENSIFCENRRYDFGSKSKELMRVENLY